VLGIACLAAMGRKILPDRAPAAEALMVRPSGTELEERYHLDERLWELRLLDDSPLGGKTIAQTDIGRQFGLTVAAIWRGRRAIFNPEPSQVILAGDMLLVVGQSEKVNNLTKLGMAMGRDLMSGISRRGVHFVEVMPAPHSPALGRTLKDLEFRMKYGLTAVALWRKDRAYRTNVGDFELSLGDSLLMLGPRNRIERLQRNPDFIVLESSSTDEPIQRRGAIISCTTIAAAVIASVAGVPVYLAMLAGAIVCVLTSVINMDQAYHAIEWRAIFLIAGMYPASIALVHTGLAEAVGQGMVHLLSGLGPLGLAGGTFLLSVILTQFMGGQVTALVTGPIAISAALSFHTNPQAIAVATAIGCSVSFLTPIAHPVNILIVAPGNYTFSDFLKSGWWLTVVCFVGLLAGMVLF
ncbi:MAG: SLC13 family permease, partial [Blastocatellia bacterium]